MKCSYQCERVDKYSFQWERVDEVQLSVGTGEVQLSVGTGG